MTNEKLMARNNLLESDNRLLANKIKKLQLELKIVKKERDDLKNDISDIETYVELERCVACEKLVPETVMSYVGNEHICESCVTDGYGR